MLVTFSSKAGADILMLGPHAKDLLKIIGKIDDKDLLSRGVLMPLQLGPAIANIEQAIDTEPRQSHDENEETDQPTNPLALPVGLRQRSYPLLDLLRRAQEQQVPVLWEAGSGW